MPRSFHTTTINTIVSTTSAFQHKLIVRTKLAAPRLHRHTLRRPRLTSRLMEALDYRLTLLQAGTGYGKSTALAALADEMQRPVWYHLDADDAEPLVFLLHLYHGLAAALPGLSEAPLALLEGWEGGGPALGTAVVDRLVNDLAARMADTKNPLLLIIDDAHLLRERSESLRILDHFIGRAPAGVHVILSARYPLKLPSLVNWRIRGEVLEIDQEELAFTTEETVTLFRQQFDYQLTPQQADLLMAHVEGWPIALSLVWQRLQSGSDVDLADALGQLSGVTGDLFTYLAREVLQQQPADIQAFLRTTSVLRQMTPDLCDCLREATDSEQLLSYLLDHGLFVVERSDGHMRYHHLFRQLLRQQLSEEEAREAHRRAARCCHRHQTEEYAIYHLLAAGAHQEAASILVDLGRQMVRAGRLDQLAEWLGSLRPDVLQSHPPLLTYLGDVARLHSRFDEALAWYAQAEEEGRARRDMAATGQALRGRARVYLDTVDPSKAEQLLQEALRISDGQEDRESRARLLELLAENLLNQGKLEQAQRYQREAYDLREQGSAEAELSMRVLLRTGRLDEARRGLEERVEAEERDPVLRPRAHRETLLLLSLVLAFQGERQAAFETAVKGTQRGQQFDSPFVTAVGHMRQGHAWLLDKNEAGYEQAIRCFERAIAISEDLTVPRLKVEASWGLCQAYGFRGGLESAERAARQGIHIARDAGDEWVEACIRVTMGASHFLSGAFETATTWLDQAGAAFRSCADAYGETLVRLWQCLLWQKTGDSSRLERDVGELLQLVRGRGYDYLFKRKTLCGPPDPRSLVPLLLFARDNDREAAFAERLLGQMGLARLQIHPGYCLKVQTLGPFRLWRGEEEAPAQEWTRKKARQLFHFLLTHRDTLLEREQITEMLWPDLDPEAGLRDFKIAYSALSRVLEPDRERNAPSAYVTRDGTRYGLRREADVSLDVARFEQLIAEGDRVFTGDQAFADDRAFGDDRQSALEAYRRALCLYQGEYLQEYPYAEWALEERERLLTLYLRTGERLAAALVAQEAWDEAIDVCQGLLARDDCWEPAYRALMVAYAHKGNRTQALRAYQRCVAQLDAELGVMPTADTEQVHEAIIAGRAASVTLS